MPKHTNQQGFTLVELIITIVVGGIIAAITTSILTQPINAYMDISRRATLTDVAESSLRRMQRDIRSALPNSIRISADGKTIEFLHVIAGGRYRSKLASDGSGDILDFYQTDTSFDVLGDLQNFTDLTLGADKLVIYPLNTAGSNPYSGDNITTINTGSSASHLLFSSFKFPLQSPAQRFFIVDTPVTYHCDTSATAFKNKVLLRFDNYAIQALQAIPASTASAVQSNHIADCLFSYNAGSNSRSGLVTMRLTLADESGESIKLVHQVHVNNQP